MFLNQAMSTDCAHEQEYEAKNGNTDSGQELQDRDMQSIEMYHP